MSDLKDQIAESIVDNADKEDIIFTKSDKVNNLMQLIFEQKVTVADIDEAIMKEADEKDRKKYLTLYANDLVKYLQDKLTRSRLSGFRSQPKKTKDQPQKLSKSEQFLERKKQREQEKKLKQLKGEGTVEKIGLKEMGKEMEAQKEVESQLEEKRKEQQNLVEEEQNKHANSYKMAFDLYAHAIEVTTEVDTTSLCEIIKKISEPDITTRQIALDKLSGHKQAHLASDALLAAIKDKNNLIKVLAVLTHCGTKKTILPLINVVKEYPTSNDLLFRGPATRAIGEIMNRMNGKEKNSGVKYMYQVCSNPKFEATLKVLVRILTKDLANAKTKEAYFTPQCFKWMAMIAEKLIESKKKKVKVGFVNVAVQTDFTKELKELLNILK